MDNRPIGVFDSGLGGLSVVRQLSSLLPQEHLVYFGDTARIPYGTRSPATIERYAKQDCRFLLNHDVKLIIAACGTVSSVAPAVLSSLPVPAMGVVQPTAAAALAATRNGKIGVLATTATIRSGSFAQALTAGNPAVQVFTQACPVLVSLVESGWIERDNEATAAVLRRYLTPLMEQHIDTLILGCTHFPLLAPILSDLLGEHVTLIDSGAACASHTAALLSQTNALCDTAQTGTCRFYVSDRPDNFAAVAEMFLGRPVGETVATADCEGLYE